MSPGEQPAAEHTGQEPGDGTARPVTVMTMRTYRVGRDGRRTAYTPTVVVPSTPQSALEGTPGLPPCECSQCRAQGRGAP